MLDRRQLTVTVVDRHAVEAVCVKNDEARGTGDRAVADGAIFMAELYSQAQKGERGSLPITSVPMLMRILQQIIT